ncbi:MAG: glutamate--tRNA ligase, partial [Firmicutes bacterium]|nr:glutamate--tRNA ligase [Bacillota bacterium]
MKDGAGIDGARPVRVRMAPSPTGSIHIGNLRTAVFNWLFTRSRGGSFIVRIEDTDRARSAQAYEDEILAELRWLGLEWDEGPDVGGPHAPYRQSERISLYQAHLRDLQEAGAVYSCYCTEDELKDEREAARRRGEAPRYSGRCRELSAAEGARLAAQGRQPSLRFRVPPTGFELDDLIHGHVGIAPEEMGDFIVARPDGIPIYNFAVTVDDHLMGITHVIRGE